MLRHQWNTNLHPPRYVGDNAEKEFNSLKELKPNHRYISDIYILYEFRDMATTWEHSYPRIDTDKYIQEIYDNSYQYEDD